MRNDECEMQNHFRIRQSHFRIQTAAHSPLKSGKISITRLTSEFGPVCFFAGSFVSVFLLPLPSFFLAVHQSGQIRFLSLDFCPPTFSRQILILRFQSTDFYRPTSLKPSSHPPVTTSLPPSAPAFQLPLLPQLHKLSRSLERR